MLRMIEPPNRLVVSAEIEAENREVIFRPKFDRYVSRRRRGQILDIVLIVAERIEYPEPVQACRDPKDDKYLALAVAAGASVIVSSDAQHLLPMHPWRNISILRPADYLALA